MHVLHAETPYLRQLPNEKEIGNFLYTLYLIRQIRDRIVHCWVDGSIPRFATYILNRKSRMQQDGNGCTDT